MTFLALGREASWLLLVSYWANDKDKIISVALGIVAIARIERVGTSSSRARPRP